MTLDEVVRKWLELCNRADAEKHELYGEHLLYWIQNKQLAKIGKDELPLSSLFDGHDLQ